MNNQKAATMKEHSANQNIRNFIKSNGSFVIFLMITICALIFVPKFASLSNAFVIIQQAAIPIIASIGMTMVLMTGGIDLSLGYNIGLTSIVVGMLIKNALFPIWLAILIALCVGLLIGFANGWLIEKIRLPAFIATLGTGYIVLGLAQIISRGSTVNKFPDEFLAIGQTKIGSINTAVIISIAIAVLFFFIIQRSTYGRALTAFGYNANASYYSGISTSTLHISVYAICGLLTAVAGILLTIRVNSGQPDMGGGSYTFQIVTAAVVGGASLLGGKGSVIGTVLGVFIIKIIENCINLLNVQYFLFQTVMGIIILLAIIFESVMQRKL